MYKIIESGLCYDKDIPTLEEAKASAERMINEMPFGELGTVDIVNTGPPTNQTVLRFEPVIDWEMIGMTGGTL